MKKILLTILFSIIILAPLSVSAAGIGDALNNLGKVNDKAGLEKDISVSLGTVINTGLSLVGTIFLGLMIYAGILWMTAQGNDEKVTKAKDIIIAAIIGLAVTMSAYAITYFVTNKLTGGGGPVSSGDPRVVPSDDDEVEPICCREKDEDALGTPVDSCDEDGLVAGDQVWSSEGTCPPDNGDNAAFVCEAPDVAEDDCD